MTNDFIQKLIIETLGVRVIFVNLDETTQTIIEQHAYPQDIAQMIGELLTCCALMAASVKFDGELTIQLQNNNALRLLVAKCTNHFQLRALAQWDTTALPQDWHLNLNGHFMTTIMPDDSTQPYQSIIPIHATSIHANIEHYFLQSEQLPTRFILKHDAGQNRGVLLQMLPEHDSLNLAKIAPLVEKVLLAADPSFNTLCDELHLHYEALRIFHAEDAQFSCRCSLEKMQQAILMLNPTELSEMLAEKPYVEINCEYCNYHYHFTRNEIETLLEEKNKA